jgi:hypothetical protein
MVRACVLALLLLGWASTSVSAAEPPALAKARAAYNAGDFGAAITAAASVRLQPEWADAAALVIGRSHIERYRRASDPADLVAGREMLGSIRSAVLSPRDQVDHIVGLGQALYLGELFGAAAEIFDTALGQAQLLSQSDRYLLLDWWATALDREAQTRPWGQRESVYERIASKVDRSLADEPANPVANYWLAVAARGAGDLDRAWSAAIAAWVRASLDPAHAEQLRLDLDRLVSQALIPERARTLVIRGSEDGVTLLRDEWERVKQSWR